MKLTKNFSLSEFRSKDGSPTPAAVVGELQKLAENLQVLRDAISRLVKINSGYRSPEHNKKVGGARNSQHLLGKAADIAVTGMTPDQLKAIIEQLIAEGKMKNGGVGLYKTFVHYDTRDIPARW
jgi:uncharacterized protein YcbK (DUF882 family)